MGLHGFGERHQLRVIGIGAGRIDQTQRQAGRAVRQLAGEHRLHRGALGRCGGAPLVSHDREPQRGMSDQRDQIERDAAPVQCVSIAGEAVEDLIRRRLAQQSGEMLPQNSAEPAGRDRAKSCNCPRPAL